MAADDFPVPDRSDHDPHAEARDPFYPQLDAGASGGVMDDGRPFRRERWFPGGMDLKYACTTWFYSSRGITDWTEADHVAYLRRNGITVERGLGVQRLEDASGNPMWSVTLTTKLSD